ncbi:MAG: hypothetical protein Q4F28_11135 [Eubacteriales bacterium]|nr:hypothetical protein [Eubacteriales bacterium]
MLQNLTGMVTDAQLFYGGLITAGGAALLAVLYFLISQIRGLHLKTQLDEEYGKEPPKRKKGRRKL